MLESAHKPPKQGKCAPVVLETPDVLAMLHTAFWGTDYLSACRNCALVALLACCYVLPGYASHILLEDWRPVIDGRRRDVVFIRRHKEWQTVYLTPTAVFAVERYLAERARVAAEMGWQSELLFVSVNGKPVQGGAVFECVRRLGRRIGSRSMTRMLENFCLRRLKKGDDEVASRRYRGLKRPHADRHAALPVISEARIARLIRRVDPFKHLERQVRSERAAAKWLAARAAVIVVNVACDAPARAGSRAKSEARSAKATAPRMPTARKAPAKKTMPVDHPLVAALLTMKWPENDHDRGVLRTQVWVEYGDDLYPLMKERNGPLNGELVAELLHTTEEGVSGTLSQFYRNGPRVRRQEWKLTRAPKPLPTEADRALIAAVEADAAREGGCRPEAVKDRLIAHLPAIADMISRETITCPQAARSLGTDKSRLHLLLTALEHGIAPERLLHHRRKQKIPPEWWDKVRAAHARRPDGDTDEALFCRMFAAGFPGGFSTLVMWLAKNVRTATPAEKTEAELAVVRALSDYPWSADPETLATQREETARAHLVSVHRMLAEGKLRPGQAAKLLNVVRCRMDYLHRGLSAGLSLDDLLAAPSPSPKEVWDAVRREHLKTPDEANLTFYFRMRADHGLTEGIKRMRTFRENLAVRESLPKPIAA
ncbi:hypothetical protein [Bradyrhizobium iriomotense]|uniref:hypothetical protein n=1 Tax=Bradyrhizobium iriomotense TaxID=441950 RepID=UPI001B8A6F52|nr:hypothetical protein [Bradyrhizobium iriomotense]MBR1133292.1 hypothetical protein [Bradyrhizobium iriomotense]